MAETGRIIVDGNEAAARVAYLTNEVVAIYPITPASPMGEWADQWASEGRRNLWGAVPRIVEMQSEGGAAGAVHGALQTGSLTTSFTSSQGLLLMIPNLYKIAGELTPMVLHVAARSLATHALSIFCDHGDVMALRGSGLGILASGSVQEVMDLALIAQAATLRARVPLIHMFDGFRTSHEVASIEPVTEAVAASLIDEALVLAHRGRALDPDHPVVRGTAQNPDVFFQSREAANRRYDAVPGIVQQAMDRFAEATGRAYRLFDYVGDPGAERVVVLMGSGAEAAHETVEHLCARGERVGVVKLRLYRPFDGRALVAALPPSTRAIAVLDRSKEPGAGGEPLYKDVVTALAEARSDGGSPFVADPRVVGGRYGLSSKELTPGMIAAVFAELAAPRPRNGFTVGIRDDVTRHSLAWDPDLRTDALRERRSAVFYGLGSDGTVSANKNAVKIIGEHTGLQVQGYFQYDSKKSGAVTVSHLRYGERPIRSTYLVQDGEADLVACHQPVFLERYDLLDKAAPGGSFLLNTPHGPERVWDTLPRRLQRQIIERRLRLFVVDAYRIAREADLGGRINTIMQTCYFAIAGILPTERAIAEIKAGIERSYGRKGAELLARNYAAVDAALSGLHEVAVPARADSDLERAPAVPEEAPDFVRRVTAEIMAGRGDALPVSLMPEDGTWPTGTAVWEKRNLAREIPIWEPELCTHCGKCPLVCPHAAIRSKVFPAAAAEAAPEGFLHVPVKGKDFEPGLHIAYQVAPEDCTGCALCVEICPIRDKRDPARKALNLRPKTAALLERERGHWAFFRGLPAYDRRRIKPRTIKGAMLMEPLFEFSGACEGCGETPYLKLATQLFGDRMLVANATGCSSIYGGNLPTTPWSRDEHGRGPAWSNSLFEDNAEFGLGFRVSIDARIEQARGLLAALRQRIGPELVDALLAAEQGDEAGIHEQRERVAALRRRLAGIDGAEARRLASLAEVLVRRSVWIVGGDGWAYDIGYGGLDHVLASGRDVNLLVMDTEVYSNTGGQTSKATPLGAVAKFSAAGKPSAKKDLALMAMGYGDVYVAQVALGAKDTQTLRAFLEAESWPGPSLIIAYATCIAHGVDLAHGLRQQDLAARSGHWTLFRYDPRRARQGLNPLQLDSRPPSIPYEDFARTEQRFAALASARPEAARRYLEQAEQAARARYERYARLAALPVGAGDPAGPTDGEAVAARPGPEARGAD